MAVAVFAWGALVVEGTHWGMLEVDTVKKTSFDDSSTPLDNSLEPHEIVLGSVGIHREFITAAARWIMEAKL